VVYARPSFGGPEAALAYLCRYIHRIAISNRRLISLDESGVTFRYKDYRCDGAERYRTMTSLIEHQIAMNIFAAGARPGQRLEGYRRDHEGVHAAQPRPLS
jgi:Putative transposase